MLRPIEIETLVYAELDRVRKGAQPEDSIVELKLALPDPSKAAWQIGALCNAVHGDDAIWVVGAGEDGRFEPPSAELAEWGPAVDKHFDEVHPIRRNLNGAYEEHPLTLIHFTTLQRPYVVNGPNGNKIVPWRDLNMTRGARRRELLSLLAPDASKPRLHIVTAHVTRERPFGMFNVGMTVYVVPKNGSRVILPFYKCSAYLQVDEEILWLPNQTLSWSMLETPSDFQPLQFIFREPTFFSITAKYHQHGIKDPLPESLRLVLQLGYADTEGDALAVSLPQTNIAPGVQHYAWRESGWGQR